MTTRTTPSSSSATASEDAARLAATQEQSPTGSTLIEFPRAGRAASRPAWRKELSERVREIQQRRAQEAAAEREASAATHAAAGFAFEPAEESEAPPPADAKSTLGLVPPRADAPPLNPIVAAALKRIERARQPAPTPSRPRAKSNGAATAAAVAYETTASAQPVVETVEELVAPAAQPGDSVAAAPPQGLTEGQKHKPSEAARVPNLVVVSAPPAQPAKTEEAANLRAEAAPAVPSTPPAVKAVTAPLHTPAPKAGEAAVETASPKAEAFVPARQTSGLPRTTGRLLTDRREAEITDAANSVPIVTETYNDHAPAGSRVAAAFVDLLAASFLTLPCAAVIELTSGRWDDPRVLASMAGIAVLVTFLYFVVTTGLLGRTPGMSLFSLRAVDVRTALVPTTGQSVKRTLFYLLSLATFGVGILYALFDAEGRTAHDHLSGTVVVRE